ncbi:hypothetical protein DFH07DRAFT_1064039 [Mycena maculata]|uniref:MYND-type domain-containing protein n=1 Tax=Mycena maculata TaxID=230809 RepID=A0AAD7N276_9AGAR|nr:hypothetical protein DFH07DRAFT_1064039 [Mycena maculata]
MAPRIEFKAGVIAAEGTTADEFGSNKLTTRTCDLRDCKNYEKLNKCARCRTAMYCSRECQKADWAHHKAFCQLVRDFPPPTDPDTGGESPLQRHLRLWTARFNGSLVCATIVALQLNKRPQNIDEFGLVVTLQPRPHAEAGARFNLVSAVVAPMTEIEAISRLGRQSRGPEHGPTTMQLHQQHRDAMKKRSGGQEDYAAVVVIAQNLGPHALSGGMSTVIRFKPIQVHRKMVRSAQLTDPTLAWYQSLEMQVERDIPNQEIVG